MATERLGETSGQDTAQPLLRLDQMKVDFPPRKERFQRTVRDGVDIIDALVSKNKVYPKSFQA